MRRITIEVVLFGHAIFDGWRVLGQEEHVLVSLFLKDGWVKHLVCSCRLSFFRAQGNGCPPQLAGRRYSNAPQAPVPVHCVEPGRAYWRGERFSRLEEDDQYGAQNNQRVRD